MLSEPQEQKIRDWKRAQTTTSQTVFDVITILEKVSVFGLFIAAQMPGKDR